ncbi:DUF881 domain-containing protein [Clostridium sp. YIM B02506]|uniref:DUF881 domain-containing protein n=1 Tax=Clostridium sp. YIM B02506 TaxID=2910680 RepID=UPI001EEEE7A9|nr:DUF881 domain-containing protein [Clostridium sp. YIM B02506]
MKYNEASIFVFIASIIIGVLIALNINLSSTSSNIQLTANEYSKAVEERNKLRQDINALDDNNNEIVNKLNSYTSSEQKNEKIIEDLKSQFTLYKMISGFEDVKGSGIKIIIKDGDYSGLPSELQRLKVLHDNDMINVVNDLRAAGAEAISINGYRIYPYSSIICDWAFLNIDEIKVPQPFEVEIIGEPKVLQEFMTSDNSYITGLKARGIDIEIKEVKEIIMRAKSSTIKPEFMEQYTN